MQTEKITFSDFAKECIKTKRAEWTNQKHGDQWEYTLKAFAHSIIGNKYLGEISTEDILAILSPIWVSKTETPDSSPTESRRAHKVAYVTIRYEMPASKLVLYDPVKFDYSYKHDGLQF